VLRTLDVVALTVDVPELGLRKDDAGTIVHVHESGASFEVEFAADDGYTLALQSFGAHQVRAMLPSEARIGRAIVAKFD
jgi:hypothetical protein